MLHHPGRYPTTRLRRTRQHDWLRRMVADTALAPADLIWPLFVHEHEASHPVASMPGVERLSIDGIVKAAAEAATLAELEAEEDRLYDQQSKVPLPF